jgi:predicted 3-demethylubiquinone-9 3-methyltransferase (glyoxalase superfamily)
MKKSELKALILECKQELTEESKASAKANEAAVKLAEAMNSFMQIISDEDINDLPEELDEKPFGALQEATTWYNDYFGIEY